VFGDGHCSDGLLRYSGLDERQ
jgi:non-heme chloroperoxidase